MVQNKNKYNTPRHRLVVRFTNKDVIAQVVKSNITGDVVRIIPQTPRISLFDPRKIPSLSLSPPRPLLRPSAGGSAGQRP